MKNALLFVTVFAAGSLLAWSQEDQTPAKLLAAAREQSDIFNHAPRPFLLEADLTVQLAVPVQGRLTIHWQSKNQWRRELEFGPYKETIVRAGEWEYAQRNVGFAPLRALQVVDLLQFAKQDTHITAKSEKTRNRNGVVLTCIRLESTGSNGPYEMCADSATHEIVSFNPWAYGIEGGSAEFSSYTGIEEMQFPKHLELRIGKDPAVMVNVTKLEEQAFDANLLIPPPGATERRYCEVMTAPVMIQKPDIASLGVFSGDVHVKFQVTILTDGSVGAIQVIGQNSTEAADRIRKVWKDARYKPAMCGTEPVVADEQEGLDITH
ncbi:MAG: hypothetical protein ABSC88_08050 [Terracidiphilus sp.]|jgi:hypothetical protein